MCTIIKLMPHELEQTSSEGGWCSSQYFSFCADHLLSTTWNTSKRFHLVFFKFLLRKYWTQMAKFVGGSYWDLTTWNISLYLYWTMSTLKLCHTKLCLCDDKKKSTDQKLDSPAQMKYCARFEATLLSKIVTKCLFFCIIWFTRLNLGSSHLNFN